MASLLDGKGQSNHPANPACDPRIRHFTKHGFRAGPSWLTRDGLTVVTLRMLFWDPAADRDGTPLLENRLRVFFPTRSTIRISQARRAWVGYARQNEACHSLISFLASLTYAALGGGHWPTGLPARPIAIEKMALSQDCPKDSTTPQKVITFGFVRDLAANGRYSHHRFCAILDAVGTHTNRQKPASLGLESHIQPQLDVLGR